jgi:hypothetical protein
VALRKLELLERVGHTSSRTAGSRRYATTQSTKFTMNGNRRDFGRHGVSVEMTADVAREVCTDRRARSRAARLRARRVEAPKDPFPLATIECYH